MTGLDRYVLRQTLSMMLFVTAALSAAAGKRNRCGWLT
jgi:lipopolysaccharide export LptBFGC system permease protein LptF